MKTTGSARRGRRIALVLLLGSSWVFCDPSGKELAQNPSFEAGVTLPEAWEVFAPPGTSVVRDTSVAHNGAASARIRIDEAGAESFPACKYVVENPVPGTMYEGHAWVRAKDMKWAWGAYLVFEFYRNGERIELAQGEFSRRETWTELSVSGMVPPGCDTMRMSLVTHGEGTAWFDDASLREVRGPDTFAGTEAVLRVCNDSVAGAPFLGFGAQGDFFLHCSFNRMHGVTDSDIERVKQRVAAMRPHIIRTFFDYAWWEPEEGKYSPGSEQMQDYVDWVSFLKGIGTKVLLTPWGDDFAYPTWMRSADKSKLPAPEKRSPLVRSLVKLVEYLRHEKGLDNITYLCLMNEPDNDGARPVPVEDFVALWQQLDAGLRAQGLRNEVQLLGPDESGGPLTGLSAWYRDTVPPLAGIIDGLSCHTYQHRNTLLLGPWVDCRRRFLRENNIDRPFLITEFGYGGDVNTNPENGKFEYALFLPRFAIAALEHGASGALMWCLFDTYYSPNFKQEYGLWKHKEQEWQPRPGYATWALMNRFTRPGDLVLRVERKPEALGLHVLAFRGPDGVLTVAIVNDYNREIVVRLTGITSSKTPLRLYSVTRANVEELQGDLPPVRGVLDAQPAESPPVRLPAESFVLLTSVP